MGKTQCQRPLPRLLYIPGAPPRKRLKLNFQRQFQAVGEAVVDGRGGHRRWAGRLLGDVALVPADKDAPGARDPGGELRFMLPAEELRGSARPVEVTAVRPQPRLLEDAERHLRLPVVIKGPAPIR